MNRLKAFPHHRFVGVRDEMVVYDCDDTDDFAALEERAELEGLADQGMLSAFGPDTLAEARNRGFSLRRR